MIGNFKVFHNPDTHYPLPMRIFTTQSKASYLDSDEMFRITTVGIKYYEDYFGVKFPFSKYDQIFVPELKICAMENVGAVTFTEDYLKPHNEVTEY